MKLSQARNLERAIDEFDEDLAAAIVGCERAGVEFSQDAADFFGARLKVLRGRSKALTLATLSKRTMVL